MEVKRYNIKNVLLSPGRYIESKVVDKTYKSGKKQGQVKNVVKRQYIGQTTGNKPGFVDPLKNMSGIGPKIDLNVDISDYVRFYSTGRQDNSTVGKKGKLINKLLSVSDELNKMNDGKYVHSKRERELYQNVPRDITNFGDLFALQLVSKNLKRTRYKKMKYYDQHENVQGVDKNGKQFSLNYQNTYYRKNAASLLRVLTYEQKGKGTKKLYGVDNVFISLVIEIITGHHKASKDPVRDMKRVYNLKSIVNKERKIKGLLYYLDLMNLFVKRGKHNKPLTDKNGDVLFTDGPLNVTQFKRKRK